MVGKRPSVPVKAKKTIPVTRSRVNDSVVRNNSNSDLSLNRDTKIRILLFILELNILGFSCKIKLVIPDLNHFGGFH